MPIIPVKKPSPDFKSFKRMLKGEGEPERVHFVELWIDEEVRKFITENLMGERWVSAPPEYSLLRDASTPQAISLEEKQAYWRQNINFFYRMGYNCLPDLSPANLYFQSMVTKTRIAEDTANLSKGKRIWAQAEARRTGVRDIEFWVNGNLPITPHYPGRDSPLPMRSSGKGRNLAKTPSKNFCGGHFEKRISVRREFLRG